VRFTLRSLGRKLASPNTDGSVRNSFILRFLCFLPLIHSPFQDQQVVPPLMPAPRFLPVEPRMRATAVAPELRTQKARPIRPLRSSKGWMPSMQREASADRLLELRPRFDRRGGAPSVRDRTRADAGTLHGLAGAKTTLRHGAPARLGDAPAFPRPRTLALCAVYFDLPKENFRCYSKTPSLSPEPALS